MTLVPRFDDYEKTLMFKMAGAIATGMGLAGVDIITDTQAHTGSWWCVHAIGGDAVFETVTLMPGTSTGSLAGKTLSNGDRFYGPIQSIKLTSGNVVLSRASLS